MSKIIQMTNRGPTGARQTALERILESLREGIVSTGADGCVAFVNHATEELTGVSRTVSLGRSIDEAFPRDPWIPDLVRESTRRGTIRSEGSLEGRVGPAKLVRVSASPLVGEDGEPSGVVLVLNDLSLQRSLEVDARRARDLDQLGGLVAGLAHEIKNPLGGIRGSVQLLVREVELPPSAAEYARIVIREVDRLAGLVEQLVQLGSAPIRERRPVNVHEVLDHVFDLLAATLEESSIATNRSYDPSLPDVDGHSDSLVQVFLNLLQNAAQALAELPSERRRMIRVRTRVETDYQAGPIGGRRVAPLRVDIEDTGPGVPSELQAKLFSPFFTTKTKGTGLGLAISHRLVTELGGTIRFRSEPGSTRFRVILPAFREPEGDPQ